MQRYLHIARDRALEGEAHPVGHDPANRPAYRRMIGEREAETLPGDDIILLNDELASIRRDMPGYSGSIGQGLGSPERGRVRILRQHFHGANYLAPQNYV